MSPLLIGADWKRARAIRPSASAVIFDRRGRVLLQQRSDGGQWGLPGGGHEIGESVTDAVVREEREETGLRVSIRGGRLTTCDETPALEWFSPRRLPKTILPNHIIRIRDARSRRARAFVR